MSIVLDEPKRHCPVDHIELDKRRRYGVIVDSCHRCHGVWLDPGEIHLLSKSYQDYDLKATPTTWLRWRRSLRCPSCAGHILFLSYIGFGGLVDIGRCRRCGGLWFDRRHLERFQRPDRAPHPMEPLAEPLLTYAVPRTASQWLATCLGVPIDIDNPCLLLPYATWVLIVANVLVFSIVSVFVSDSRATIQHWGAIAAKVRAGEVSRLFTAMFLHADLGHLAGNMFFLYTFGDNVEERFGAARFALLYFTSGIASALAFFILTPSALAAIGASGAISGVLGAYLVAFPRKHLLVPIGRPWAVIRVRVLTFVVFWLLLQVVGLVAQPAASGGIGYSAHLGGVLSGMLVGWLLERQRHSAGRPR